MNHELFILSSAHQNVDQTGCLMSLKPVVVVIPQRTLRFLSASGLGSRGCPHALVARRQGMTCIAEVAPSSEVPSFSVVSEVPPHGTCREDEEDEEEEEEGMMLDNTPAVIHSRATKHKAVEQRRKRKISEGIQQLLRILKPTYLSGKLTRAEILEKVVDKIKSLKEENEHLKLKIDSLPQPGGETELYGKLSNQVMEFMSLKSQLQQCIERQQQQQRSHDQGIESCDSSHGQITDDNSEAATTHSTCSSQSTITITSSPFSAVSPNLTSSPSCTYAAAPSHASAPPTNHRQIVNCERSSPNESIVVASEVPPINQETPPTDHTWPVTLILSQVSQHTTTNTTPITSCHGSSLRTDRVLSSQSATAQNEESMHPSAVSRISISAVSANSPSPGPSRTIGTSNNDFLRRLSLGNEGTTCSNIVNQQLRGSHDIGGPRLRSESVNVLASGHDQQHIYHHHHHQPSQQHGHSRERHRDSYLSNHAPSLSVCYHPPAALQQHTPSIVQPWVESHQHRPRPLHHMTKTTPRTTAQYPLHHHNREQRLNQHNTRTHTERFVPYPSPTGRVDRHTMPTFSSGSWSHSNHVTFAGSSSTMGHTNIAQLGRSYASAVCDPNQHQQHLTSSLYSIPNNFDYSNNYSSSQGQLTPFCHTQRCTTRSRNMMSHDSTATPPYPIQPPPHTGSNSNATVWRPYSERSRSGFCLADILSLPSETETPPLQLESTPPSGHRSMDSFLVNRLLDDI